MKNHFKIIEDQNPIPSHEERNGSMETDGSIGLKHFTNIDHDEALSRPFFFFNWLFTNCYPVDRGH
jgi:hypothetical protein